MATALHNLLLTISGLLLLGIVVGLAAIPPVWLYAHYRSKARDRQREALREAGIQNALVPGDLSRGEDLCVGLLALATTCYAIWFFGHLPEIRAAVLRFWP